jgi:hypothetical protein
MLRRLLNVAGLFLLMTLSPAGVRAFGVNDVIKLHMEQLSDSLIVLAIQNSHQVIRVRSDDFRRLKQAGVSDQVMSAMLRTELVGFQKNAENHTGVNPYGWAHYSYGPYPYPRSSFSLAFSYGYGGYMWPVYRPYYYRPYFGPYVGLHYRYPYRRW